MTALARAAADARAEADQLLTEAKRALILEGTSGILYDVATDAIDAWRRAENRATLAQQLADQEAGGYNVWDGAA